MKTKVLFVCLGNICRSPGAEAVFTGIVKREGLIKEYEIDSAGTSGWHVGEPADERMQSHASKRGYNLTSISRRFNPFADFDHFDFIVGMDDDNVHDLKSMARSKDDLGKIYKMTEFSRKFSVHEIPDPFYGGAEKFELVLDLLEDACEGLLNSIENGE